MPDPGWQARCPSAPLARGSSRASQRIRRVGRWSFQARVVNWVQVGQARCRQVPEEMRLMDENHDNEAQSGIPTDPTPVVPRADVTWELPMEAEQGAVPI